MTLPSPRDLLLAGLFAGAAIAFGFSLYALGVWLALGATACFGHAVAQSWFLDRPDTLVKLDLIGQHTKQIEDRIQFLITTFTSAFPNRPSPGGLRSPLRPPSGNGPR